MHVKETMIGETATVYLIDGTTQSFRWPVYVSINPQVAIFMIDECKALRRVIIPIARVAHIVINGDLCNDGHY